MATILPFVTYANLGPEDADTLFSIIADTPETVAARLTERFGFRGVAMTRRESHSARHNGLSGLFYLDGVTYASQRYELVDIVDRLGGGDAFTAGLLYGLTQAYTPQDAIEFATAAACLKHTIYGDFNRVTLSEVQALVAGDGSGRVRR